MLLKYLGIGLKHVSFETVPKTFVELVPNNEIKTPLSAIIFLNDKALNYIKKHDFNNDNDFLNKLFKIWAKELKTGFIKVEVVDNKTTRQFYIITNNTVYFIPCLQIPKQIIETYFNGDEQKQLKHQLMLFKEDPDLFINIVGEVVKEVTT